MPQPQQLPAFFDDASGGQEFSVVLRGYDGAEADGHVQRPTAAIPQAEQSRAEAEQRMNESQRRLRQAEQRLSSIEQKLTDTNKQLEENSRPTLSGLGTRVEQILRLAEEQANDHRAEAKPESEGSNTAARLEAREITDNARAEAAAMHAHADREASHQRAMAGGGLGRGMAGRRVTPESEDAPRPAAGVSRAKRLAWEAEKRACAAERRGKEMAQRAEAGRVASESAGHVTGETAMAVSD